MSITATDGTNYMSNEYIMGWMETHTEGIYGKMREAMDTSETRAHAEDALNQIKAAFAEAATKHKDSTEVSKLISDAFKTYGAEFPDLSTALQPIADQIAGQQDPDNPGPILIGKDDSDRWSKDIDGALDAMGKQDQLGLLTIQEFNAQLNQSKQTASALMDSADKSASSIISHIS